MSRTFRLFYSKVDSGIVSHSYDTSQSPDGLSRRTASSDKQPHIFRGNYHGEQYSELINGSRHFNLIGIIYDFLNDYFYKFSVSIFRHTLTLNDTNILIVLMILMATNNFQ